MVARPNDRQLTRSTSDRVLLGVAGGLGAYLGLDPVVVRLAFALGTLVGGIGVLVYLVLAIAMPAEPRRDETEAASAALHPCPARPVEVASLLLVGVGLIFAAWNFGWLIGFAWSTFWPIILIAFGVMLLLAQERT